MLTERRRRRKKKKLDMTVSSRWHVSCRLMLWLKVIPWWLNTRWHILEDLSYCIMLMHTWVAWLYNMLNWLTQAILPQIDLWILKMDRGSSAYVQLRVLCSNYSIWSLWMGYSILVQMICWSLLPQMIVDGSNTDLFYNQSVTSFWKRWKMA